MKLPDLQQTNLDERTLDALFADIAACTEILSAMPKASPGRVAGTSVSLEAARSGLRDGSLRGVQIRYRHEDREWCDTLIAMPGGGTRLVRICTDEAIATTTR